jgi:hypothetical protein
MAMEFGSGRGRRMVIGLSRLREVSSVRVPFKREPPPQGPACPAIQNRACATGAPDPLRKTGIRVIGDMPWGAHIWIFYETKHDLLDTAASYFGAGLKSNEFCVWAISDPINEADAENACGSRPPMLDGEAQRRMGIPRNSRAAAGQAGDQEAQRGARPSCRNRSRGTSR